MSDMNNNDLYSDFEEDGSDYSTSSGSGNRTFMLAIGILGGIFLIALIVLAVFALFIMPQRNAAQQEQAAQINAQNTATAFAVTEMAIFQQQAMTTTAEALATIEPSPTSVVVFPTDTPAPEMEAGAESEGTQESIGGDLFARTQTVAALLTQAAAGGQTTTTALPTTGFADDVGLPGLLGLAILLIGVIFLARRLRVSTSQ